MKKTIIAAMAVSLVLAGCAKTEVTNVSEAAYIGFDNAYVGNATKAINGIDTDNIDHFFVFAQYGATPERVFTNQLVTNTDGEWNYTPLKPWVENENYLFAAYYIEGNTPLTETTQVTFTTDGKLTFTDYVVDKDNQSDLLYDGEVASLGNATRAKVQFNFDHLLSWITFDLKSGFNTDVTLELSNVKFYGMNSKADYSEDGTWSTAEEQITSGNGMTSGEGDVITGIVSNETAESAVNGALNWFVMPQTFNDDVVELTFTVTLSGDGVNGLSDDEKTFDVTAKIPGIEWEKGYHYTYTATLTGSDKYITFDAPTVNTWQDGGADLGNL